MSFKKSTDITFIDNGLLVFDSTDLKKKKNIH